jgi:putative transposase
MGCNRWGTGSGSLSWCEENGVEIRYIQPGKPNQNALIECFSWTHRDDVLNAYLFEDLDQVREINYERMINYNERRPHDALGGMRQSSTGRK